VVRLPKDMGGLEIRYPLLMNISLGENLVWWLIAGDNNWWKQVLHKKYVNWVRESYTHHIPHNRGNS